MPTQPTTADLLLQAQYASAATDLARLALPTAFIPDSLKVWRDPEAAKGRDGDRSLANVDADATVSQVALAIVKGTGLGFGWTESLEAIIVINNRPYLSALALRALIQRTPYLRMEITETTATRAIVTGWRRGDDGEWGAPQTSTWHLDRARAAGFRGFTNPDGMWRKMPGNMLLARATAEDARMIGADVVLGVPYVAEEADTDTGEPEWEASGAPALPAGTAPAEPVTRRRPSRRAPAPPPPGSGTDAPDPGGAPPPGPGEPMSADDQRTQIHADLVKLGITTAGAQRAKVNTLLGTGAGNRIGRMTDLTLAQARTVIAALAAEIAARDQETPPESEDGEPAARDPGKEEGE